MKLLARIFATAALAWLMGSFHGATAAETVTTPIVVQGQIKCVAGTVCTTNLYTVPIGGTFALQGVDCSWPVGKMSFLFLQVYTGPATLSEMVIPFHPQGTAAIYDGATFAIPITYKSGQVVQLGVEAVTKATAICTIIGELTSSPPS